MCTPYATRLSRIFCILPKLIRKSGVAFSSKRIARATKSSGSLPASQSSIVLIGTQTASRCSQSRRTPRPSWLCACTITVTARSERSHVFPFSSSTSSNVPTCSGFDTSVGSKLVSPQTSTRAWRSKLISPLRQPATTDQAFCMYDTLAPRRINSTCGTALIYPNRYTMTTLTLASFRMSFPLYGIR